MAYIYIICVCLRMVVSNTYCVVFLFRFSSSCVPLCISYASIKYQQISFALSNTTLYICSFKSSFAVWIPKYIFEWHCSDYHVRSKTRFDLKIFKINFENELYMA